jgi:hypothetical protein
VRISVSNAFTNKKNSSASTKTTATEADVKNSSNAVIVVTANEKMMWQSSLNQAMDAFLMQIKTALNISPGAVLISYCQSEEENATIKAIAKRLERCLMAAGLLVKLAPLVDDKTLEQDLSSHKFGIIICSPAYAAQVDQAPQIRPLLETFGRSQKNALHTLLCAGGFGDTAFKVVLPHYLVRDFRAVVSADSQQDALYSEQSFVDIFFNSAGSQGLGILPDILGMKDKANEALATVHQQHWQEFERIQQRLTVDYRLQCAVKTEIASHPLREYQDDAKVPLIPSQQSPGIVPALELFLKGDAKTNLWLGATNTDVELMNLVLADSLSRIPDLRVLSIECGQHSGKAAGDCVRVALTKLKIKGLDSVRQDRIIILLQGYHNIGTYDSIYAQNRLSSWDKLKVLVTCRADFFQTRGYLKCFLPDASNRRVDDLLVYKVPAFASKKAQKVAISVKYNVEATIIQSTATMSAKRQAQLAELTDFLISLRDIWIENGDLKASQQQNPQVFISYAWEGDKTALTRQQQHLARIAHDLTMVGLPTWLDIEQMTGNIDAQMADNIANSQIAIVIGTPRYTERTKQDTNVKKEYEAILARAKKDANTDKFTLIPIQFLANAPQNTALPTGLLNYPNMIDFQGIDDGVDYLNHLADPQIGIIPKLLVKTSEQQQRYLNAHSKLQTELQRLVGKHLVVNQGIADKLSYDMEARLKGQLTPYGLVQETSPLSERFDLKARFETFLKDEKAKTFVLLGRAGSGKSLFGLSTFVQALNNWQDYLPLYISLKDYAQYPDTCIERALQQQFNLGPQDIEALKQGLSHQQRLLFILDGYDELGSGVRPNYTQRLAEWPTAKLLITSRPEHFDDDNKPSSCLELIGVDGKVQMGAVEEVFVSPFSNEDIESFVAARGNGVDTLKQLQELPGLMDLLNNPFLLTLVLQSLPQLLQNRGDSTRAVTRAEVYTAFTETWFKQETKGRDLKPEDCVAFSQDLSFQFFKHKMIAVPISFEKCETKELKYLWQFLNDPKVGAVQDAASM